MGHIKKSLTVRGVRGGFRYKPNKFAIFRPQILENSENSNLIDTKILQFDLLVAEIIGSKAGNPT